MKSIIRCKPIIKQALRVKPLVLSDDLLDFPKHPAGQQKVANLGSDRSAGAGYFSGLSGKSPERDSLAEQNGFEPSVPLTEHENGLFLRPCDRGQPRSAVPEKDWLRDTKRGVCVFPEKEQGGMKNAP